MLAEFGDEKESSEKMFAYVESIHQNLPKGYECILLVFNPTDGVEGGLTIAGTVPPETVPMILEGLAETLRSQQEVENN